MRLLISAHPTRLITTYGDAAYRDHLGLLLTPRFGNVSTVLRALSVGGHWAIDNDAFNGFDRNRFIRLLKSVSHLPGCQFVACPDVVGNAEATLLRFGRWNKAIHYLGFPSALVAQDGLETLRVPWDDFEALFVGGTTKWKLSQYAVDLCAESRRRGKWVHIGRVNGRRRLYWSERYGADSVDGSGYAKFSKEKLPSAVAFLQHPYSVEF